MSSVLGSGLQVSQSDAVKALTFLHSVHNLQVPSDLGNKRQGDAHSLVLIWLTKNKLIY